ncbi:MAG TPA: serine protease [Caldilineaceae bacterium]|nr:serine protease [Caldilineaceae bacterium]
MTPLHLIPSAPERSGATPVAPQRAGRWWSRSGRLAVTFLVLVFTAFAIQPAAAIDRAGVERALRATVQIVVPDQDFENFSLGSGTILNDQGLILTNHHVVEGDRRNGYMNDEAIAIIGIAPNDLRGEAVYKYFGEIVKSDPNLDLALIQIIGLVDDPDAPLPANLGLTSIPLGNSDDLMISDEINIFGFPGVGGNTATYTRGIVSGFLDEDRDGVYEWIKSDAELNPGNSGGLATDSLGQFVGVPTARNMEGAGMIGLVRSGNLALSFVNSFFPNPVGDGPQITRMQFSEAVNRRGEPINPGVQFRSGITDLYAVFDFTGFEDGADFTYVWYLDGGELLRDSFAWDLGESGSSWLSIYNDEGLADGFTEVEIIYNGDSIFRSGVMVGEGPGPGPGPDPGPNPPSTPEIGPITFAADVANDQPVDTGASFAGLTEVFAFFDYSGMTNGTPWTRRWYLDGQMVLETEDIWNSGTEGTTYISIYHPDGLPPGEFTLELYVDGELLQSGSFTMQGGGEPQPTEVTVIGVVVDRNNSRQTISGALIVFLVPGVTVQDWIDADFPDSMVHAVGTSNRRGEFQLDNTVTPGEFYSVVVVHDDYEPITVDDFQIPPDATDPYELEIAMDRS